MKRIIFILLVVASQLTYGQLKDWQISSPINFETTLSGSFAEMRKNHFHGGLDFRTYGEENKPIYAIDEGYISKITISSSSYGKFVQIIHPNGYTSTYAHLNGFVPKLDSIIKNIQYKEQKYEIEVNFSPTDYPVKKGEKFAISGNTGASAGPHLHFEIRKTDDNSLQNPMQLNQYFHIQDNRAPKIFAIKIYGMNYNGLVNDLQEQKFKVIQTKSRQRILQTPTGINAWGEIGFSVKASDYMNGTSFTYSPRTIKVFVDDSLISNILIDNIKMSDTRALNSFIDYRQWAKTNEFFMKSFKDCNSPLCVYGKYKGTVQINKEKEYNVRYEVFDDCGNKDQISFVINGKKTNIQIADTLDPAKYIHCGKSVFFEKEDFCIHLPENAIYNNFFPNYHNEYSSKYYSKIHQFGDKETPLHTFCDLSIKVDNDTIKDKTKYYIAKVNSKNIAIGSVSGNYIDGFMVGKTNVLGRFSVLVDHTKPRISAIHTKKLKAAPYLKFKIFDTQSGISSYDAYIDDKWILFEYDYKTHSITHWLDKRLIATNKNHTLKLIVKDRCGNSTTYTGSIYF